MPSVFDRRLGSARFAMLVVPDHWSGSPIAGNKAFAARLRGWADAGVEMFLHGFTHRDDAPAGFKARHLTASEGEFLSLTEAEAARRLREGRAIVEDAIGRPVAGFIAPAWLYGEGARPRVHGARLCARRGPSEGLAPGRWQGAGPRPGDYMGQPVTGAHPQFIGLCRFCPATASALLPDRPARRPSRRYRRADSARQHRCDGAGAAARPRRGALC